MKRHQSSINVGFWNINKLISKQVDKSKDNLFIGSINKCDIICLAEVKSDISSCNFNEHVLHYIERKCLKGKQSYGGLGILVKRNLKKGVKYMPSTCSEYQWILMDRDFLGFDN